VFIHKLDHLLKAWIGLKLFRLSIKASKLVITLSFEICEDRVVESSVTEKRKREGQREREGQR
jgi:hypothetical protein